MTDNEIVKALECCKKAKVWGDCEDMGCPAATKQGCHFYLRTDEDYEGVIQMEMLKDALDLINRQKAEIERYKNIFPNFEHQDDDFCGVLCNFSEGLIRKAKTEAIKEFAAVLVDRLDLKHEKADVYINDDYIARIVEEMTEETK